MLLLRSTDPGPWRKLDDVRAEAEPRINAWIADLLGSPAKIRFAGRVTRDGVEVEPLAATPGDIELSPLSLLLATSAPGTARATMLEDHLAALWAPRLTAAGSGATLEILAGPPAGAAAGTIGLRKVQLLLQRAAEVIQGRRAAVAADLALPDRSVPSGVDAADVEKRANHVARLAREAARALTTALTRANPTAAALRGAIAKADRAGFAVHAAPRDVARLRAAAAAVAVQVNAAIRKLDQAEADPPDGAATERRVAHHLARIRAVLGESFPLLPRFAMPSVAELRASDRDRAALVGDGLVIREWLQRTGMVRHGVDLLQRVITAAELLHGPRDVDEFRAWQLPHRPGAPWAALPQPPDHPLTARLALAVHCPSGVDLAAPLTGVVCDEWVETIPGTTETTGLSLHYDAPGSRAPQAVLLAVPGDRSRAEWSILELIDAVREAADLAAIRMVGPAHLQGLGLYLPLTYLPHNFKHDVPSVDIRGLVAGLRERIPDTAIRGKGIS